MLTSILDLHSNYTITNYQTLEEVIWLLRQEKLRQEKFSKNLKKQILSKILKNRKVKLFKTIPLTLTTMQSKFLIRMLDSFFGIENGQVSKISKKI